MNRTTKGLESALVELAHQVVELNPQGEVQGVGELCRLMVKVLTPILNSQRTVGLKRNSARKFDRQGNLIKNDNSTPTFVRADWKDCQLFEVTILASEREALQHFLALAERRQTEERPILDPPALKVVQTAEAILEELTRPSGIKKRAPRRPKEVIEAEKAAKAARKEQRELNKFAKQRKIPVEQARSFMREETQMRANYA
jgi:hypothetical protein